MTPAELDALEKDIEGRCASVDRTYKAQDTWPSSPTDQARNDHDHARSYAAEALPVCLRAIRALRKRVEEQAKALRSVIALFDESDETRNYQNEPARDARISVNGLEQIRALIGDPHA